jgi:chaperonin GroES
MKLKVIDERLLVQVEEPEEAKTAGGIYIPDTAKEKPQKGKVVAVGTDEDLQKVIKVGDRVVFGKYTGDEIEYDGKKYLVIQRADVLAIIT